MNLHEKDQFDWKDVFELFKKPGVKNEDIRFPKVNEEKIREILIERHDFSKERVDKQLEKLRDLKEKAKQRGLDKWF